MDRDAICRRVVETAERFGAGNPQETKLLMAELGKCEAREVLAGLLLVFSSSDPATDATYVKQELAGRLLAKLAPRGPIDLAQVLRAVLPGYNLSIEQVPQYLAMRCGKDAVVRELRHIETNEATSRVGVAARTMRWWLGDEVPR